MVDMHQPLQLILTFKKLYFLQNGNKKNPLYNKTRINEYNYNIIKYQYKWINFS